MPFIIREIDISMGERDSCVTRIRRSRNRASHFMAILVGCMHDRTAVWLCFGPDDVMEIVG